MARRPYMDMDPAQWWIRREIGPTDIREEIFARCVEFAFAKEVFDLAVRTFPDDRLYLTNRSRILLKHPDD